MEDQSKSTIGKDFIKDKIFKVEHRLFLGKLLGSTLGYTLITFWLNSIRATAPLWFVWTLIIVQFSLYFLIFFTSYQRTKGFGFNNNLAFVLFVVLAVLGRVNDWELLIIPFVVLIMFVLSLRNKKVSEERQHMLPEK